MKLIPLNQTIKSNKICLDCYERALFILFLPFGAISGVKSPYKKENKNPEKKTCALGRCHFLPYFFWVILQCQFSKESTFETRPSTLGSTEVLKEGVRPKLVSKLFLLFGINVKERKSPENKVWTGRKKVGIMHLFE